MPLFDFPNRILKSGILALTAFWSASQAVESPVDTFGIQKFYPTKTGSVSWNSGHWNNGHARELPNWKGDPEDPFEWTDDRSSDGGGFYIDGQGVMQMKGTGPRFHINSQQSWAEKKQFFKNVEFTAYYKRDALGGENYGGMVMGVRSGALGHGSSGGNNCDANTYYARFRNDGKWDFEKEWKHPGSYYQSGGVIGKQTPMWGNGAVLPVDRWIGMKYIVYNVTETSVKLELYIDSISGGEPFEGNPWQKVGEALDEGLDWPGASGGAAVIEGCVDYNGVEDSKAAILEGGGIALMRSDKDNPYYKHVTLREICIPELEEGCDGFDSKDEGDPEGEDPQSISPRTALRGAASLGTRIFDLKGRENRAKSRYIVQFLK